MAVRKTLFVAGLSMLLPVASLMAPMGVARAGTVSDDRLRAVLVNDATCLVQYDRPRVDAFLKMTPGTPRIEQESRLISGSACLQGDRLSYEPGQLRGALFIALYQAQYATADPGVVDPAQEATAWPRSADARSAAVQQFATCAVRADPEDARRIVLASPESSDESAGISGLRPHLDGCFPKGGSIIFNRMALSGLLAEALYRLAPASPVSGI